jgi:hypothetical protein
VPRSSCFLAVRGSEGDRATPAASPQALVANAELEIRAQVSQIDVKDRAFTLVDRQGRTFVFQASTVSVDNLKVGDRFRGTVRILEVTGPGLFRAEIHSGGFSGDS